MWVAEDRELSSDRVFGGVFWVDFFPTFGVFWEVQGEIRKGNEVE